MTKIGTTSIGLLLSLTLFGFLWPSQKITIIAGGDVMLGRGVEPTKAFSGIHDFLLNADQVFVNFEGVISKKDLPMDTTYPKLFLKPEVAGILHDNHVTVASLANNHSLDAGPEDFSLTRELLTKNGILPIGHPTDITNNFVVEQKMGDKTIVWIAANTINVTADTDKLIQLVKEYSAKENHIVIVSIHFGIEYSLIPSRAQISLAHTLVDNGATLILGSHPHVVQPVEKYKDRLIFYSLGNLVFDQNSSTETMEGLLVKLEIRSGGITFHLFPTRSIKNSPHLMSADATSKWLHTYSKRNSDLDLAKEIEGGIITTHTVTP